MNIGCSGSYSLYIYAIGPELSHLGVVSRFCHYFNLAPPSEENFQNVPINLYLSHKFQTVPIKVECFL